MKKCRSKRVERLKNDISNDRPVDREDSSCSPLCRTEGLGTERTSAAPLQAGVLYANMPEF